ncbi:MAG: universal stress protein [Proteobacteria bacterium]|nr:universal stress protein [Pseudomonadota bacterium]
MKTPTTILVATDFSEAADHAVDYAVGLAQAFAAKLFVVNAIPISITGIPEIGLAITNSMMESIVRTNQEQIDKLVARYPQGTFKTIMNTGDPREVIINTGVQVGADLLVVGTHGRRGLSRALVGSVAETVVRHAHCPVLVIR